MLLGLLLCITDHAKGFQRCIEHKVMEVNFILEAIEAIGGLIEMTRWVTISDLYFRKIILEAVWGMNWSKEWWSAGSPTRKQLLLSGKGEQIWGNILGSGNYKICGQVRYEKLLHHEEIGWYYETSWLPRESPKGWHSRGGSMVVWQSILQTKSYVCPHPRVILSFRVWILHW